MVGEGRRAAVDIVARRRSTVCLQVTSVRAHCRHHACLVCAMMSLTLPAIQAVKLRCCQHQPCVQGRGLLWGDQGMAWSCCHQGCGIPAGSSHEAACAALRSCRRCVNAILWEHAIPPHYTTGACRATRLGVHAGVECRECMRRGTHAKAVLSRFANEV